jgi:hypothetical protein
MDNDFLLKDKRKTYIVMAVILVLAIFLSIVNGPKLKPVEPVDYNLVESQRTIALENALFNAQAYRATNPRFAEGFSIVPHTDETIGPDCIQGDGWANLSIMKQEDKRIEKYKIVCSTVSPTLGCYLENDFKSKNFSNEEGFCQPNKVPKQLKKIAK